MSASHDLRGPNLSIPPLSCTAAYPPGTTPMRLLRRPLTQRYCLPVRRRLGNTRVLTDSDAGRSRSLVRSSPLPTLRARGPLGPWECLGCAPGATATQRDGSHRPDTSMRHRGSRPTAEASEPRAPNATTWAQKAVQGVTEDAEGVMHGRPTSYKAHVCLQHIASRRYARG